ncbi:MAG: TolC family protein [Acidobacteria bacterium]|nr:TolC family protein [Acidobacteriota bacterium]
MSLTARICGLVIILIGGRTILWSQEKSSDLSTAGLSTPKSSPPSVPGASATTVSPQLPQPQAAEARVVALDELVTEALDRNPEILVARRKFDAATKRPSQVSTLPEPKFNFTNFGVGHPASALNRSEFAYLGIGVSQEFPFPGKLSLMSAMARKEADSERQMVLDAELRVISRLKQAYFDLSYSYRATEIVEKNRDLLDKFTKIAEAKYRVGSGIQQDVLKAQVEISTLMQRLEMLSQQRGSLEAFINSLLNRPVSMELGKPAPVNKSELSRPLDELLRLAQENAPRIRGRQEMLDSNAFALNLARKEYMPDFGASFQYQKTGSLYPDYYMATFEVKVPLYFWRKQRLGVEEAATRLVQTRHEYQMTSQEISFGVKDQFLMAKTSERLLAMYEQGVIPQAAASLESALAGYQTGKVDFLTLINNLTVLLNFEMDYYRELSNQQKAVARLEEFVGVKLQ